MMRPSSPCHLPLKCMTYRKLNDLIFLMNHVVILETYNGDRKCVFWDKYEHVHVPETVEDPGHGNQEIQGSTVSVGPKAFRLH